MLACKRTGLTGLLRGQAETGLLRERASDWFGAVHIHHAEFHVEVSCGQEHERNSMLVQPGEKGRAKGLQSLQQPAV